MNDFSFSHRIKFKAIAGLMLVMFGSMLLTSMFALFFSSNDVQQETVENEMATAIYAKELFTRTTLTTSDIASMCTNNAIRAHLIDDVSIYNLTDALLQKLQKDEIITLPYAFSENPVTLVKLGDAYLELTVRSGVSLVRVASFRIFFTILSSIAFLSVLLAFAGGKIVNPITTFSKAMNQVAKGDFSTRLPAKRDDELGLLATNFNNMVSALGSIEYLQKDFISNVSHEFKTPIASISGYAKLLKSPELDDADRAEYTDIIISESQRLSHLSQNLLRLSKLENQQKLQDMTAFSLDEQLRRAVLLLEPEWSKKRIDWELDLTEMTYHGEAELLAQVWINILSNAIKFSPEDGRITVKLYQTDWVKVKITDQGPGMAEDVQARIFDKFYQGDPSRSGEGNGLGLALVKRIVDLSGGQVHVKSVIGQGTTFTVSLPIHQA